jgi:hypothetical protein
VEEVGINQSKGAESFEFLAIQSLLPRFENEIKKNISAGPERGAAATIKKAVLIGVCWACEVDSFT